MSDDVVPAGGPPARLDAERLRRALVEHGPWSRLERVDSVDSTNLFLQRAGADPAAFARDWPHLSVLTAEEQIGGRGRIGRAWSSPAGTTLSTSVVLRPDWHPDLLRWASLLAALSLAEVLDEEYGIPARVKWPNDVHVADRKISGILALVAPGHPDGFAVILGMGVNVLLDESQLPTETSTSVLIERRNASAAGARGAESEVGAELRTDLLIALLRRLAEHLQTVDGFGGRTSSVPLPGTPLRRRLLGAVDTIGRRVRVELPDGAARRGTAVGLADDGALIVEVADERASGSELWSAVPVRTESFSAVDVVHLRPEDGPRGDAGTAG